MDERIEKALKHIKFYNNTCYAKRGVRILSAAQSLFVAGNLICADDALKSTHNENNLILPFAQAKIVFANADFTLGKLDVFPVHKKSIGKAIQVPQAKQELDIDIDFNAKKRKSLNVRGAYAGSSMKNSWPLAATRKEINGKKKKKRK